MKVVKYDKATNTYSKPFDVDFPPLLTDDMKFKPHDYQKRIIDRIVRQKRLALLLDMKLC